MAGRVEAAGTGGASALVMAEALGEPAGLSERKATPSRPAPHRQTEKFPLSR